MLLSTDKQRLPEFLHWAREIYDPEVCKALEERLSRVSDEVFDVQELAWRIHSERYQKLLDGLGDPISNSRLSYDAH